jgi:hypothetical protein
MLRLGKFCIGLSREARLLSFSRIDQPEHSDLPQSELERDQRKRGVRDSLRTLSDRVERGTRAPQEGFRLALRAPLREEARVRELEARVTREGEFFCVEGRTWTAKTDISAHFAAELIEYAERFERYFSRMFPRSEYFTRKVLITVYSSREKYLKHHRSTMFRGEAKVRKKKGGRWVVPEIATHVDGPHQNTFAQFPKGRLNHELIHAITINSFEKKPSPWFTEGLAGYFETWDLHSDLQTNRERHVRNSFFIGKMKKFLRENPQEEGWLKAVMGMKESQFQADRTGKNYSVASSFISYLMSSPQGRETFARLLKDAREGKPLAVNTEAEEGPWKEFVRRVESAVHF